MPVRRSYRMRALALAATGIVSAATLVVLPSPTAASAGMPGSPAALHLRLVRADPSIDSTYVGSPATIRLWFSERVKLKATSVTITDQAGSVVKLGPLSLDTVAKAPVVAKVLQPMKPGRYTVAWRAMGRDSHIVKNQYSFTLVAATSGPAK